jgi:hypothetical protein
MCRRENGGEHEDVTYQILHICYAMALEKQTVGKDAAKVQGYGAGMEAKKCVKVSPAPAAWFVSSSDCHVCKFPNRV